MKKKLLAIAGSPRRGGNTDTLLEEALRAAHRAGVDTYLLKLSELKIFPCTDCGACRKNGECVQQDGMQTVYPQLLDSDYIVIASPLYFMGVSAQLKAMIDRCQALWARRFILKKELRPSQRQTIPNNVACEERLASSPPGERGKVENPESPLRLRRIGRTPSFGRGEGESSLPDSISSMERKPSPKGLFISTAALNKGDKIFAGSIQTVKALFYTLGVEYKGEVLCHGLGERGGVRQRPELLEKVYQATLQLFSD